MLILTAATENAFCLRHITNALAFSHLSGPWPKQKQT